MSAPMPPSRLPQHPTPAFHHHPGPWLAPRAAGGCDAGRTSARPAIRRTRTVGGTTFEVVARIGTAVTLAALLVVVGTALAMAHTAPTPAGVTTTGR